MRSDYLKAAGKPSLPISIHETEAFRAGLALLDTASANIAEAGKLFATIDETTWRALIDDAPAPMRRTLNYVRLVGEGKMIPQLATAAGEAAQKMRFLPVGDQYRLWTQPVEVFAPGRIGRHAKYMRYISDMDSEELKRVFERDGIGWKVRSYDEQKSYEAEKAAFVDPPKPSGVDRPGRWAVRNGKVYLAKSKVDAGLTKRDVESILKDLEDES